MCNTIVVAELWNAVLCNEPRMFAENQINWGFIWHFPSYLLLRKLLHFKNESAIKVFSRSLSNNCILLCRAGSVCKIRCKETFLWLCFWEWYVEKFFAKCRLYHVIQGTEIVAIGLVVWQNVTYSHFSDVRGFHGIRNIGLCVGA